MTKKVYVVEVPFGDKKLRDENGYRKDTMPIVQSLRNKGVDADVVFYTDEKGEQLFHDIHDADAVISRVNPGNLPAGEKNYFAFLSRLVDDGVLIMSDPKTMTGYGAKDAMAKITSTGLVPKDTYAYYSLTELKENFPKTLATGKRVLKQNRGSQGSGIWLVEIAPDWNGDVCDDTSILATEAFDNHEEQKNLGDFLDSCEQYFGGDDGQMVDMAFLPRISEGEIRVLMVGKTPVFVIHKVPQEGGFSATLGSGAEYTYQTPEEWSKLMDMFLSKIDDVKEILGGYPTPLIWTADFILGEKDDNGNDTYILGEINCSCVGFTSQLDVGIQDLIADEVLRRLS